MAVSIPALQAMTTVQLQALRTNYIAQRRGLPRQHRGRGRSINFPTDIRRCDDAVRLINRILAARRLNKKPLALAT